MSDPNHSPTHPPPGPPPQRPHRNPIVAVLMVVFGMILLLPGICALIFTSEMRGADPSILVILVPCLGVSVIGVLLIVRAFR